MSARWWENERSLLAARVRSTRRRLRASFRGVQLAQYDLMQRKLEESRRAMGVRLVAEVHKVDDALKRIVSAEGFVERDRDYINLGVSVRFAHEVLARVDREEFMREIAVYLGRSVENAARNLDVRAIDAVMATRGGEEHEQDEG